jgi:HipA-like protein
MKAGVYNNGTLAGVLEKRIDGTFLFEYDDLYLQNAMNPSISLSMNRSIKKHESKNY